MNGKSDWKWCNMFCACGKSFEFTMLKKKEDCNWRETKFQSSAKTQSKINKSEYIYFDQWI